jgi:subfamily B ATP-binding cassette protein HlyB/CyaB
VPQETVLFSGTLYDNLVMAHPHASFDDVIAACKAAEIHEVIETTAERLSDRDRRARDGALGRAKAAIAIARALLKRPKILIFDEAVSNLDQQTAEHFAKTINKLKGKVTMIFITHQIPRGACRWMRCSRSARSAAQYAGGSGGGARVGKDSNRL